MKNLRFEENYNCLFRRVYQKEWDEHELPSKVQEKYRRKACKSTLSVFDDKRS